MISAEDRRRLIEELIAFAKEASVGIMSIYASDFAVEFKSADDPVTRADKEANALLCNRLVQRFPGVTVVAEESDPATFAGYGSRPEAFFVDPIDGTREFVARNGEFCVMLGFAEEGTATAGVILCPALKRIFAGGVGVRAFEESPDGKRWPIVVSSVRTLAQASLLVSRAHTPESMKGGIPPFGMKRVVPCGSSGIKACRVAAGEAEAYAQPGRAGMLWDVCAPEAIVHSAGGRLTDAFGAVYDYRRNDLRCSQGVLASNGHLHDALLHEISQMIATQSA